MTFSESPANDVIETRTGAGKRPRAAGVTDETGIWPHVRGSVGLSSGARGYDGQFFIDLVDNPRFDHRYTVFAQVLNGFDVIDRVLEGDVIDRIDILP